MRKFRTQTDVDECVQANDDRKSDMIVPDALLPAIRQVMRLLIVYMKTYTILNSFIEIMKRDIAPARISALYLAQVLGP